LKKRIKVSATYSWEFDRKDWKEAKEHWNKIKEDIKIHFEWDNITMFHSLNDIRWPDLPKLEIEEI